ncbi:MAG: 3-oxoacyl-ACP synthase [Bacteroidales bacterium]|nr:3-oxoacyl-ACP synthase [Bacteroidales bacterium]
MISVISHNIISPIGDTSLQNYSAVKAGNSALSRYEGKWQLPEPFFASLFTDQQNRAIQLDGKTRFESLVIASISKALENVSVDVHSPRSILILSTTKGNVELLADSSHFNNPEKELPGSAANTIASHFGFSTKPIVVCNACISGVSALVLARRLLESKLYDNAVVCGADVQSAFIVSGFQSFKALSPDNCRPFDESRVGLNLGEAAATIVLTRQTEVHDNQWYIISGGVRNDANHISGPSRTGEGSYRALLTLGAPEEELAFINAHGTATLYNDEMESIALDRAGYHSVTINALKGYYGHTMGAAGILETIISMCAVDDNTVIATRGYEKKGVSGNISVSNINAPTDNQSFIKLLSGFGGCNAALWVGRGADYANKKTASNLNAPLMQQGCSKGSVTHRVSITPEGVTLDGVVLSTEQKGKALLTELYKANVGDYPKFYKMDVMTRLGFMASELLLKAEGKERFTPCENRAVILFNRTSSLIADKAHQESINDPAAFFPSPSVFVYTLPNIITGEIAIRNKYYGETSFYILEQYDETVINQVLEASFLDTHTTSIIAGWVDCESEELFNAQMYIVEKEY